MASPVSAAPMTSVPVDGSICVSGSVALAMLQMTASLTRPLLTTVAANVALPPFAIVAVDGETVTLVMEPTVETMAQAFAYGEIENVFHV